MNRTTAFLGVAVGLLLIAVVLGLPRHATAPTPPAVTPAPVPAPVPVAVPAPAPVVEQHPGSLSMTGKLSHPFVIPGTSDVFATLDVTAVTVPGAKRAPVNLALVIDRSGSMAGQKLQNAKRAADRLVDLLQPTDRLAIVHYGNDANVLGGRFATEENKALMHRYIAGIVEVGGTNIGEGLSVGRLQLMQARSDFSVNRLLLLSDGQPTVGITSFDGLANIVSRFRSDGISVTSLGVGADFNERLMQRLADVGGGSYGFAGTGDGEQLVSTFARDLAQAGTLVARNVSITFPLENGLAFSEVYGRQVSRSGNQVTVTMPDFSAGQTERVVIHLTKTSGAVGAVEPMGAYALTYEDVLQERHADAAVSLSSVVIADQREVVNKMDKVAFVAAKKAQAQRNYEKAADAIATGDLGSAQQALRANDILFDDAAVVAGPAAISSARAENEAAFGLTVAPAPMEQRREQAKGFRVQGLKSTGRGESVY